ncbi:endopeptidase La [Spiroplasma endosymbiont of Crioceris asparagi]|uniref:endopeptidase La n=1 Tax=Spiroplasma endosymbiont of Crioceris asparagi TaxID=3066286 RepID=UPI0030CC884D
MKKIPALVTRGSFVFPKHEQILEIGRDVTIQALNLSKEKFNNEIILVSQKDPLKDDVKPEDIFQFGVLATFTIKKQWKDGTLSINVKSLKRAKDLKLSKENDTFFATYTEIEPINNSEENSKKIIYLIEGLAKENAEIPSEIEDILNNPSYKEDTDFLVDSAAQLIPFISIAKKQEILEEINPIKRMELIIKIMEEKQASSDIESSISKKIKTKVDNQQREYFLREKLKVIKEELGELDAENDDLKKYRKMIEDNPYPDYIKKRISQELDRLESMHPGSSEANVLRSYIDWIMSIPWFEKSEENINLEKAQKILDEDHFGLEKPKERIIEYLAVKQNTNKIKGQIITLVGPPGVGKTSLAKSIAKSMNRNFVKISLGGVRDEAEIRGHRKTYIGSSPGRIIQGMKKAKVINPVFLLDEIDKMGKDHRGDPASAMLEVLDPEQNSHFSDHYIEEEYDLSNVVFIATANYPGDIPEALYDRMDMIELSSYTEIEKKTIAKKHLVPKILKEYNIDKKELKISDEAIDEMIKYYTREAGVRQLERLISSVARKYIVKKIKDKITSLVVTKEVITEMLKKRIFEHTLKEEVSQAGVVTGLAYTQYGGDILPIEVTHFPGKGGLVLTGKLGDVMKESAAIAYDYVKSNYKRFGIPKEVFAQNDVHIHVPEGAVPKDGPSAGVAITTAIISSLTGTPVSREIGMTGEITLRGLVFPIGGLKEKSISAHRSGLTRIIIPFKNQKDLDAIPKEVKDKLEISFAKTYDEVYEIIFNKKISEYKIELPTFDLIPSEQNKKATN